ncbi:hypothetical protein V6N13_093370 [Hibiscus sabdariffa]
MVLRILQEAVAGKRRGKWLFPQRIQVFLWLTLCGNLLMNVERKRRHLAIDDLSCGVAKIGEARAIERVQLGAVSGMDGVEPTGSEQVYGEW